MDFYILTNNSKQGPFRVEELASRGITSNTMVWAIGFPSWKPAKQVPELANLLSSLSPESPFTTADSMPKTWLVESVLVTALCCLPFGIIGIINATKIESLYRKGEYDQALNHSKLAKKWTLYGFFSALVLTLLYLAALGIYMCILLNN